MLMPVKASDLPREVRERLDLGHGCTLRCASCGRTFTAWQPAQSHAHDDHISSAEEERHENAVAYARPPGRPGKGQLRDPERSDGSGAPGAHGGLPMRPVSAVACRLEVEIGLLAK